ncbi:hypothetical protein JCM10207_004651 [Rhodosporidiobolus poonsookiae]
MSTTIPQQFTGWAALDEEKGKKLEVEPWSYTPKKWNENDVDIKVDFCGVCGSCCHTLTNGWPRPTSYPAICGHEVVGTVVRAGANTKHKVGDRVGVGAQGGACLECEWCEQGLEQMCDKGMRGTYQGVDPETGAVAQGGYADYMRCQGQLAVPIPKELDEESAAPLLCAGVTVYAPLKRFGCGPGKKVAIIGIGGLGHLALQIAKAMGAEVYALSHSARKLDDAEKLGLKRENFIIAKDKEETKKNWSRKFDIILLTSSATDIPLEELYFPLLRPTGTFVLCALPEKKLAEMYGQALVGKSLSLAGSLIGGSSEIKELFDLSAKHGIRAWSEVRPMSEATRTLNDLHSGNMDSGVYRFVLKNESK